MSLGAMLMSRRPFYTESARDFHRGSLTVSFQMKTRPEICETHILNGKGYYVADAPFLCEGYAIRFNQAGEPGFL